MSRGETLDTIGLDEHKPEQKYNKIKVATKLDLRPGDKVNVFWYWDLSLKLDRLRIQCN